MLFLLICIGFIASLISATDIRLQYIYQVEISVCFFVCPIITQEPLDRFVSNYDWRIQDIHGNVLDFYPVLYYRLSGSTIKRKINYFILRINKGIFFYIFFIFVSKTVIHIFCKMYMKKIYSATVLQLHVNPQRIRLQRQSLSKLFIDYI